MAGQTIASGVSVNHDSATVTGLLDGEAYTINGGSLTIDADVRWGQNAAVIGNMTCSATQGGNILIDGSKIWELTYTSATGNVPTLTTLNSNGVTGGTSGATGEFFRVWATGALTPTAAAAAMPATGKIKLRSKTGTFVNGETVTLPGGATIVINGAGVRSWIHAVGAEAATLTLVRLGSFTMTGDWYYLGTTNGAGDQTFQFPVADACPAIQIETSAGSGVYEWYLNATGRWGTATATIAQDDRGKFFGQVNSTGVITIARRATNACGYLPATGCKVRIPNIICSSSTATDWTLNTLNATLATRYDFTTTSAGKIVIDKASMNWYLSCVNAFSVAITNSAFLSQVTLTQTATTNSLIDVGIGIDGVTDFVPFVLASSYGGTTISKMNAARHLSGAAASHVATLTNTSKITLADSKFTLFSGTITTITRGNASPKCISLLRCFTGTMTNVIAVGTAAFGFTTCFDFKITGTQYADIAIGTTGTTLGVYTITCDGCSNIVFDGLAWFASIANVNPYLGLMTTVGGSKNIDMVNIGTYAAPLNLGTVNAAAYICVATVSIDLLYRRIFVINTRTAPFSFVNTVEQVEITDVRSDYADSGTLISNSTVVKGGAWTYNSTGQTAQYGFHFQNAFTSTTACDIVIACNEPTVLTNSQITSTFTSGSGWTSTGHVALINLNDNVIFEWPHYIFGISALNNLAPVLTGTNTGNHTLEFQYDKTGTGYNGSWISATGANLAAVGTITPTLGIRLKFRLTCSVASTTNVIRFIRILATTSNTDQQSYYPIPGIPVSLTGLQSGSEVRVYNGIDPTTAVEIAGVETSTTTFSFEHSVAGSSGYIVIFALGYTAMNIPITYASSSVTIPIQQVLDRVYVNP